MMTTGTTRHYPGRCDPGSPAAHACAICAPYYREEMARLAVAEAARLARYGSQSCPRCGRVYAVSYAGVVAEHIGCSPVDAGA